MTPQAKTDISHLSHDPADKLAACLNHAVRHSPEYKDHRGYFDACAQWWVVLTSEQRETALVVIDAFAHRHRKGAEGIAATLPSAPKCPL